MGETVTSKYYKGYWILLFGFPSIGLFLILSFFVLLINDNDFDYVHGLIFLFILLVPLVTIYLVKFLGSIPQKIVVSPENITVDQFLFGRKHFVINYDEIDSSKIVKHTLNSGRSGADYSTRSLVLDLHNGTTFRIHEADFDNYSEMKQAIYDHLFRGK